MIKKMGCMVDCAENGEIAVRMVCERNKFAETKYALILMDINMPVMNGYIASRVINELIEKGEIQPTPILCLSAQDSIDHRERCLECGILERGTVFFFNETAKNCSGETSVVCKVAVAAEEIWGYS